MNGFGSCGPDPRLLERWWGPPTHPATMEKHDLTPGGEVTYFMTGPDGQTHRGWWRITSVDPPTSLEFTDDDMPISTLYMRLTEHVGRTRMELRSTFESREQMQQVIDMGTAEGLHQGVGQMDALLADSTRRPNQR